MGNWNAYTAVTDQFNQTLLTQGADDAYPILANSLSTFEALESDFTLLIGILHQAMDSNKVQILSSVKTLNSTSVASNIAILAIMVFMTWLLTRLICGPLAIVMKQSNAIAKGDLSQTMDRSSIGNDELGTLANASEQMQQNLRQLIDEIISAVTQLSSAVEEMTQISNQSADGMKEQQYQITQVATAMTQMKAAVADVARNTEDSASQAMAANHKSQEGARENASMVRSIQQVADIIGEAGQTVSELEQQSSQINVVVDVIRSIADQTNLLALNAAIEAARAGESGRGFAVVADEVRTLAGRTQDSTGEITTIIEKLQVMAKQAKDATERSRSSIDKCVEQGNHSQSLMISIEESIANIADVVHKLPAHVVNKIRSRMNSAAMWKTFTWRHKKSRRVHNRQPKLVVNSLSSRFRYKIHYADLRFVNFHAAYRRRLSLYFLRLEAAASQSQEECSINDNHRRYHAF